MKKLLFATLFTLYNLSSVFYSEENTPKEEVLEEVKENTGGSSSLFTPKRILAQLAGVAFSDIVMGGAIWLVSEKGENLVGGFFGDSNEGKIANLVVWSTVSALVGFYVYLLVEKGVSSGSLIWFFGKMGSGLVAILVSAISIGVGIFCGTKGKIDDQDFKEVVLISYLGGVIGATINLIFGWLVYKGIDRFFIKQDQNTVTTR